MNVFGMVTTRPSHAYTACALRSFFETTPLRPDDRFFLIDNDGTFDQPLDPAYQPLTLVRNPSPLGFAANVNRVLRAARELGADLFFLNNDLVFTPHWLEPLLVDLPAVLSPLSNFQEPYTESGWACRRVMELADYRGHEAALRAIVRRHQAAARGYRPVPALSFFCVKIPRAVYAAVGGLDERFGPGGGEDTDYCLRCQLAGFRVLYAMESYVLHFVGRSTWRGAESVSETQAREGAFRRAFEAKWGAALLDLLVRGRIDAVLSEGALRHQWDQGNFRAAFQRLSEGPR